MANLITNVSKYLMILLIAIYTYYNFRFFGIRDEWGKQRLCRLQNVVMVLIHTLAYLIIYLRTEDEKTLMFFGAQLLFFFLTYRKYGHPEYAPDKQFVQMPLIFHPHRSIFVFVVLVRIFFRKSQCAFSNSIFV